MTLALTLALTQTQTSNIVGGAYSENGRQANIAGGGADAPFLFFEI